MNTKPSLLARVLSWLENHTLPTTLRRRQETRPLAVQLEFPQLAKK